MRIKMKQLLQYRNTWLGIAMIWIVLSHSDFSYPSRFFFYLKNWGYGGVDICLLASGFGCYFSLDKETDVIRFLQRRVQRLGPTYLCFIGVWLLCRCTMSDIPHNAVLGNILGIQYLTNLGYSFNWYIGGLVVYYILAPYLKALADHLETIYGNVLAIAVMLVFTIPFWNSMGLIVLVTRIPVFYIGFVFGKLCKRDWELNTQNIIISVAAMVIGIAFFRSIYFMEWEYLWAYGLYWYPFILITPGLCIVITFVATALERSKVGRWINKIIECIGRNSFEVYLVHLLLYETVLPQFVAENIRKSGNLFWFATIPVIAVGCIVLKSAAKVVSGILRRKPYAA